MLSLNFKQFGLVTICFAQLHIVMQVDVFLDTHNASVFLEH